MKFLKSIVKSAILGFIFLLASGVQAQALVMDPVVKLCQSPGMFAMTFDQGPSIYSGAVLDAFDARGVKATFHPIVTYLHEATVVANLQRASMEGHTIGLSMEADVDLSEMSDSEIMSTIDSRAQMIASITGSKPYFLRIPNHKSLSNAQLNLIISKGYIITTYNLDSYDYNSPNVLQAYKNVLDLLSSNTKGAFISVQRDYIQDSANATPDVIDYVMEKGYNLVTLDKCVRNANGKDGKDGKNVPRVPTNMGGKTSDPSSGFVAMVAPLAAAAAFLA